MTVARIVADRLFKSIILWATVQKDLPPLAPRLEAVLRS
jgi:hypothetical protein